MKLLAFTNPKPGREDEYNDWYDNIHLKDLLDVPGIVTATRYKLFDPTPNAPAPQFAYLAVYEGEGDPATVISEIGARAGDGRIPISDALDVETTVMTAWVEI